MSQNIPIDVPDGPSKRRTASPRARVALIFAITVGMLSAGLMPAQAATWGGDFDNGNYNVTINSNHLSQYSSYTTGQARNNWAGNSNGFTVSSYKQGTSAIFEYRVSGGSAKTLTVHNNRQLSLWWAWPDLPAGSSSVSDRWTLRGDAIRQFNLNNRRYVDIRWQRPDGTWRWSRIDRTQMDANGSDSRFQLNRAEDNIQAQINAAGAIAAGTTTMGTSARVVVIDWFKNTSSQNAVFALCGIGITICTVARNIQTQHRNVTNAMESITQQGYGWYPSGGS